jgi:hypothetical protein
MDSVTLSRCRTAANGRPLVANWPWAADPRLATSGRGLVACTRRGADCWSPATWRLEVVDPMSTAQGRPATSSRPPAAGQRLDKVDLPLLNFYFFSPAHHFLHK